MTHPLDLDELVGVDKMRWMCLASNVLSNLVLAVTDAVVENIGMVALVPYADQTLAAADIDLTVMSCLRDFKKKVSLKSLNKCFSSTYKAQAGFDLLAVAYLSKLIMECKTSEVLA